VVPINHAATKLDDGEVVSGCDIKKEQFPDVNGDWGTGKSPCHLRGSACHLRAIDVAYLRASCVLLKCNLRAIVTVIN
jgi:hypothetical protein